MDIWVMNADGTDPVRLTNAALPEVLPAWSPDGKKIAFDGFKVRSDLGFVPVSGDIYVVGENGKSLTNLTKYPGADDEHPDWSPK
jgi:Tol biopolymer transport system component